MFLGSVPSARILLLSLSMFVEVNWGSFIADYQIELTRNKCVD